MITQLEDKFMAVGHVEKINTPSHASDEADTEHQGKSLDNEFDAKEVRKLVRKIDFRLIPALAFLYAIALIDRGNLPNARLAGMDEELGISKGNRYSILTMMFFVPYVLFEFPGNLAMRKIGPATWLGSIGILWGVVTIGMGFTHTWGSLLVCRIIFGAFEAGLFPGAIYLLSSWYQRWEIQKRFSGFYVVGSVSNGFASLIAYGIQHMDGLCGFRGWRWIFIIEGIASSIIGIIALLVLIDFPDRATKARPWTKRSFLSEREASVILARIARDRGQESREKLTLDRILTYLRDWKVWEFALLILCNNATVYSFAYFLPLILREGFGYSLLKTYALILPPYVFGAFCMFFAAWVGDKYRIRGPIIIVHSSICIMGMSMMAWLKSPGSRYVSQSVSRNRSRLSHKMLLLKIETQ